MNLRIASIIVGERRRKKLGDVQSLADSIAAVGLLHPPVVTPDHRLIAGERRLAALRLLGWTQTPVTVVDLADILRGEHDENFVRIDFSPSEAVAIGRAVEDEVRTPVGQHADQRDKETFLISGQTRDKAAEYVGMSGRTLEKARRVVEAAEDNPALLPLVEKMDETGKIDGAYKALQKVERDASLAAAAVAALATMPQSGNRWRVLHEDIREVGGDIEDDSLDAIITDPPYPEKYLSLYAHLGAFAAAKLRPGGSLICMVGQSFLPQIMRDLGEHLIYHWTAAYLTPGGQAVQLWDRKVNTFWKPLLWYVKGEYGGPWVGDVCRSETNHNDKRFHGWGQSESGMADVVNRFTKVGDLIGDPFCGAGTTGVVAIALDRLFVGVDVDDECVETTTARLAAAS